MKLEKSSIVMIIFNLVIISMKTSVLRDSNLFLNLADENLFF
jgi:hypothetical protein